MYVLYNYPCLDVSPVANWSPVQGVAHLSLFRISFDRKGMNGWKYITFNVHNSLGETTHLTVALNLNGIIKRCGRHQ